MLKQYGKKESGDNLFKSATQLALSISNQFMFVTDYDAGNLQALTKDGNIIWKFSDLELKQPWGVCVLSGQYILVCGRGSNNVLQVDKKGKRIRELLGPSEKLNDPLALAFDRETSRLLIGNSSNEIHVYTLSKM
ncbi:uncharacterized protein LOC128550536 [Mercenaria mercenaria]|uniref:uncharacterized protein LOC128550536 n=1 Tax=Mercenaria mercenaria TaxID=6596 RepID=UPI00234F4ED7|nr:uncharacterized protein LOC128550536 [Mercenaria mercenaria]